MTDRAVRYGIGAGVAMIVIEFVLPTPLPFFILFFGTVGLAYWVVYAETKAGTIADRGRAMREGVLLALLIVVPYLMVTGALVYPDTADTLAEEGASGTEAALAFLCARGLIGGMVAGNGAVGAYVAAWRLGLPPRAFR
jgi:hypothetical protein